MIQRQLNVNYVLCKYCGSLSYWSNINQALHGGGPETDAYLYVLDHALKVGGPLCPCVDQVHCPVKVLHVLSVHLHKRRQLLEDVSDARIRLPATQYTKSV